MSSPGRTLTIGATAYPLILPSLRDSRLHVAAVVLSVHLLGQVALGFQLSVPQLLAAILTCAILEVSITFYRSRAFVWPASAMLTGSGIALILRVVGTPPGDHWSFYAWEVYAAVAGLSLLSKYVIRYRGVQVFNPSNVGLVVAFVLLGSTRVEPLDFWWAPLGPGMLLAYAVIVVGGSLIDRRLSLIVIGVSFWIVFAAGLGVLAASGHCMTTNWAFAPVCGADFWRVLVTSPEVMVFLFFMLTDPRVVPTGRVGKAAFGAGIAVISVLLMAPQTDEFGTKVGLLASLVIACVARPLVARLVPSPGSGADSIRTFAARVVGGGHAGAGIARGVARVALVCVAVLGIGVGIVAAGSPARGSVTADVPAVLATVPITVDASAFHTVTVAPDVLDFDPSLVESGAQAVLRTLAENLEYESQALLRGDPAILAAVDHGDRLKDLQARLADAKATGRIVIDHYRFDTVHLVVIVPFGVQTGASLGFDSQGTVTEDTYDAAGVLQSQRTSAFAVTFAMRRVVDDRWHIVAALPPGSGR